MARRTLRRSTISIALIVGAYSGNVRSTGTFAITDRSVNELPIPRFLRAITIPVNQFARRLFSSTSTLTLTTSPGRNGTTALDAATRASSRPRASA